MGNSNEGGCFNTKHLDAKAVGGGGIGKGGSDIDAAVLAAANFGGGGLAQKLEISFGCEELVNMDTFSKSDPFVVLFKQQGNVWQKLGQTEIIHDNLNPKWVTKIKLDFHFEQSEKFKVQVFDSDDDSQQVKNLAAHDFIGELLFSMHEVVTARDQQLTKPLANDKIAKPGRIVITAEEVSAQANAEMVIFDPIIKGLSSSSLCFFILYRNISPGKFVPIYKSEIKKPVSGSFAWNQV